MTVALVPLLGAGVLALADPPVPGALPPTSPRTTLGTAADGQPRQQIVVYTMDEGDELFERYGHAAICVSPESAPERELCYNFGTTHFDNPLQLGWDFLRGQARFHVSMAPGDAMVAAYVSFDRTVWRQRILLPQDAANELARTLDAIAHDPARRSYVYHHFFDNCSTRLRDLLNVAYSGRLASRPGMQEPTASTYRELGRYGIRDGSTANTALLAVSDVMVGRALDRAPTGYEAMFLPSVLRARLAELGARPELLYTRRGPALHEGRASGRIWYAVLAAALAAPVWWWQSSRRARQLALVPGSFLLGIVGLAVYGLAAITSVPELRLSEAFAIFLPTDLALPFVSERLAATYVRWRLLGLLVVVLLLATGFFVQPLWAPMLMPLAFFAAALFRSTQGSERASTTATSGTGTATATGSPTPASDRASAGPTPAGSPAASTTEDAADRAQAGAGVGTRGEDDEESRAVTPS